MNSKARIAPTGTSIAVSGQRALSGSSDKTAKFWEISSGRELADIVGFKGDVKACFVTPDGGQALAADGETLLHYDLIAADGAFVVMSSNLARRGIAGRAAYSASKAGVEGAVRSLAKELGPRRIRINAVAPGLIRTEMSAAATPDDFQSYAQEVPLGRVGEVHDVAPVVAFLLGPDAGYITGQVIDIDGGFAA